MVTEWVVNTCRHKNVFLQKFLVEELDPTKAVTEKSVIEVIFGPQPIVKQPFKRALDDHSVQGPNPERQVRHRESISVSNWDTRSRSAQNELPNRNGGIQNRLAPTTEPSILANLVFAPDRTYETVKNILEDLIELN